jgi:hypothetical protein
MRDPLPQHGQSGWRPRLPATRGAPRQSASLPVLEMSMSSRIVPPSKTRRTPACRSRHGMDSSRTLSQLDGHAASGWGCHDRSPAASAVRPHTVCGLPRGRINPPGRHARNCRGDRPCRRGSPPEEPGDVRELGQDQPLLTRQGQVTRRGSGLRPVDDAPCGLCRDDPRQAESSRGVQLPKLHLGSLAAAVAHPAC